MHPKTTLSPERLPVLDGLRFFAAFLVMIAHYTAMVVCDQGVTGPLTNILGTLSGIGMPLFFVLSGFVIHYNYNQVHQKPNGLKNFLVARFTRIYPLYIVIFAIEFFIGFHLHRGSCGHAGDRWGFLLALPYYLTLTQDWIYGIIATNSLIYQYHMAAAVSWSISLELFFYLFYLLFAGWLVKQKSLLKQVAWIVISQIFVLSCILFITRHEAQIDHVALIGFGEKASSQAGYQDSLLRWLYYFNPIINLPAFFIGALIANLYLRMKNQPLGSFESKYGGTITFISLASLILGHYLFYIRLAPYYTLIGRSGSLLIVPFITLLILCLTRYSKNFLSRSISHPILVKLGEASYSIYLLHAFFLLYPRDFYYLGLNPWLLFAIAMACILVLSRLSYILFERPVQKWLRRSLMGIKAENFKQEQLKPAEQKS